MVHYVFSQRTVTISANGARMETGRMATQLDSMSPKMIGSVHRNQCLLVPVNYDQSTHIRIADAIAEATVRFFLEGWKVKTIASPQYSSMGRSFLTAWVDDITYLAPAMKHPGFSRRIRVARRPSASAGGSRQIGLLTKEDADVSSLAVYL